MGKRKGRKLTRRVKKEARAQELRLKKEDKDKRKGVCRKVASYGLRVAG